MRNRETLAAAPSASRSVSSVADALGIPDLGFTIWGASGFLIQTFHGNGTVPYWACMVLTGVMVRTAIVPVFIKGARASANFAKVAPEVQYAISFWRNDTKRLKMTGGTSKEQTALMKMTLQTLRTIFKIHKVNLFDIFKSPLLQIPFFWYFSIDIRHIINGANPELAQSLTESGVMWITDLCEPDPFYVLPIFTGALLYGNVEMAVGRRALSGETSSQSDLAKVLKDFFQSLALFMPCFMAQQPSGVQIYLLTSMFFSLGQSAAMRNDQFRTTIGLPKMGAAPPEGILAKGFAESVKRRREAKERGDDILGEYVLLPFATGASLGKKRSSSIAVEPVDPDASGLIVIEQPPPIYGFNTPPVDMFIKSPEKETTTPTPLVKIDDDATKVDFGVAQEQYMAQIPENVMEAANRGEKPIEMAPAEMVTKEKVPTRIDGQKLAAKRDTKKRPKRPVVTSRGKKKPSKR